MVCIGKKDTDQQQSQQRQIVVIIKHNNTNVCPHDRTEDLNREEWATTVLMGAAVLPLGVAMRFLPPSIEGERNFAGYKPRYEK